MAAVLMAAGPDLWAATIPKTKFFVVGALPRSGTAWAAALLNMHAGVHCFHDLVATAKEKSYSQALRSMKGYNSVGDCSSAGVIPAFDDLIARRVFISRDEAECWLSLTAAMGRSDAVDESFANAQALCEDWIEKFNPHIISFENLFKADERVRRVEAECLVEAAVGMPLSERAWSFMKHLNVQIEGLDKGHYDGKKLINRL